MFNTLAAVGVNVAVFVALLLRWPSPAMFGTWRPNRMNTGGLLWLGRCLARGERAAGWFSVIVRQVDVFVGLQARW